MDFQRAWRLAMMAVILCGLSSTGYAGPNGVNARPNILSFGNCTVGANCPAETVTVTNSTREIVKIESATLSSSSLQFAYSGPALPLTLGPGQSFSGSVLFVPTVAQTDSGKLTFERADRQLISVGLSGTGVAPVRSSPVTPTITWTAPAAINYGTALSECGATGCFNECGGKLHILTGSWDGTHRGKSELVRDVHADQYDRLQHCD